MATIETTTYDSLNRLKAIQLTNGQKLECVYDADNLIVSVVISGGKQLMNEANQELSSNQKQNAQPPVVHPDANANNTAPENTQKSTTRVIEPEPTIPSPQPSPPAPPASPSPSPPTPPSSPAFAPAPPPPPPSVKLPTITTPPPVIPQNKEQESNLEAPLPPPPSVKKPTPPPVAPSNNPRHCTGCAQSISPTAVFCGHCGTKQ